MEVGGCGVACEGVRRAKDAAPQVYLFVNQVHSQQAQRKGRVGSGWGCRFVGCGVLVCRRMVELLDLASSGNEIEFLGIYWV